MTDKEYNIQKKRVEKLKKKWIRPIGLAWWSIKVDYFRTEMPPERTTYAPKNINGYWQTAFTVSTDYYYQTASIDCYLLVLKDFNDQELEQYFVHELMHIFLAPLKTSQRAKEEELVATQLANALIWNLDRESTRQRKNKSFSTKKSNLINTSSLV